MAVDEDKKSIYLIVSSAAKLRLLPELLSKLLDGDYIDKIYIISTPNTLSTVEEIEIAPKIKRKIKVLRDKKFTLCKNNTQPLPKADAILVAPATFNLVSKIACGIADNYATTVIATAIAEKIPTYIAPSYDTMWNHPKNNEYITMLEKWENVWVIWPDLENRHITMAPIDKISDSLRHRFNRIKFQHTKLDNSVESIFTEIYKKNKDAIRNFTVSDILHDNRGSNGCFSIRDGKYMIISASGSRISELDKSSFCLAEIDNKNLIKWFGKEVPSSESPLHKKIYETYEDVKCIIHIHRNHMTYSPKLHSLKTSEYIPYGDASGLDELIDIIDKKRYGIMRLHGEVAIGKSAAETILLLEKMENEAKKLL